MSLFKLLANGLYIKSYFWDENKFSSLGKSNRKGEKSSFSSHDFDDEHSFMKGRSVADSVNSEQRGINGRVKPYSGFSASDIIIDGCRNPYRGYSAGFVNFACSSKGAISPDYYKVVNFVSF
jgi:hypothetical protein